MAVANKLTKLPYPPKLAGREWADVSGEVQEYLFKVAAMAESVTKQVTVLTEPPPSTVTPILAQYAQIYLTTTQSTNLAVGNHLQFDKLVNMGGFPTGEVSLSTGSGQANGIVTLQNRRYLTYCQLLGQTNEGVLTGAWHNLSNTQLSMEGGALATGFRLIDSANTDQTPNQTITAIFDARSAPITMKMRFLTSVTPTSIEQAFCLFFPLS